MAEKPGQIIASVGRRIAEARQAKGWSQEVAAEKLKMPLKNLQRYEKGVNMTIRTLVRIARGLGVPTRTLLDEPESNRPLPGRPRK